MYFCALSSAKENFAQVKFIHMGVIDMKNKIAQFLMLIGLTVGLAVFAEAQTGSIHKVEIPFDFIVGEKTFTAGKYAVSFGILQNSRGSFLLRSADGKQAAIVNQTIVNESDKNIKTDNFVFIVYNGKHYLAEITTADRSVRIRNSNLKGKSDARFEIATAK